jgi:hypothetical protein
VISFLKTMSFVALFALAGGAASFAQDKPAPPVIPIKVQVVLSRWQGDKKISSLPYSLSVNVATERSLGGRATLRLGTKVPVATTMGPQVPGAKGETITAGVTTYNYQDVGTNIDCSAQAIDGGRFRIEVTIEDSSILQEVGKSGDRPSFRNYRATDSMILKDGETGQFSVATDKVTGETTKVDVTLTVVK